MPPHPLPLPCRDTPPSQDKDALPGKKKPARAKEGNALCPIRLVFTYIIRALIDSYIICIFISHQGVTLSFALNRFLSLYLNISHFCNKVHINVYILCRNDNSVEFAHCIKPEFDNQIYVMGITFL